MVKDVVTTATISISASGQIYIPVVASDGTFSQVIHLPADQAYAIIITATDQAGNSAVVQRNITKRSSKAKIYLGTDDVFTVSNSGAALYGGPGSDTVTIAAGVTGVILDQNVERINLSGASSDYTFKQTGNKLNVYDATGSTLLVMVPVQGDSDGTLVSFSNGMASAALSGSVMKLGGATVPSDTAGAITPVTTPNATAVRTGTTARIYLGSDDIFIVTNSGATLYGGSGSETVTISSGVSGVILDQNVDRINFSGASNSYAFKQTGNKINTYSAADASLLLVSAPIQGDSDGTVLSFSDGKASTRLSGGVMTLGGATVSSTSASVIVPILTP
jgi:hypothetical protein